jgi:hypothetical protein
VHASFSHSSEKPAQVYLTLQRKKGDITVSIQARLNKDSGVYEATVDVNKDFEMKINGEYNVVVHAADYRAETSAEWKLGSVKIWYKEGLEDAVNNGIKADYMPKGIIEFSYPPEPSQINLLFPLVGIALLGVAFLRFFVSLLSNHANLGRLNFSGVLFLGNLLLILTIFTAFYIEVKLIPTLWLLLFLSLPTFLIAQRALSSADCSIGEYRAPVQVAATSKKNKND